MGYPVKSIQSPQGDLKYCFITGQGRLKPRSKDEYSYSGAVILSKKAGKKFYKEIVEFFNEHKPKKCKLDEPENTIYQKLDDGRWMFQFRTNTVFVDKKTKEEKPNKVKLFNSKNLERELPEGVGIGDGSTGSILGAMQVYEGDTVKGKVSAGCSMYLNAIRLAKFVKYEGGASFDDDGAEGDFEDFDSADFPEETPKKEKKKGKKKKGKK